MKNNVLLPFLFVLMTGAVLAGCGAENNNTGAALPNNPPVANPPTPDDSASEEPSAEEPPVEELPIEEPPAAEPVAALVLDADTATNGVKPNGSIVLISDRALDATSVETSLELRDASTTETLPAEVDYSAEEQKITITPAGEFVDDKHYAVHLKGVRDIEGNAVAIAGQSVVKVRRRLYSRTTVYKQDGNIESVTFFQPVPGTNQARKIRYISPGIDGNWDETDDNDVVQYSLFEYRDNGVETEIVYDGPGEGGAWFDDNDDFQRAYLTSRNPDGRETRKMHSTDAGDDGELFTHDDNFVSAGFRVYDDEGKLVLYFYAGGSQENSTLNPGDDQIWLTGDDTISSYQRRFYDDAGRLQYDYKYIHPGSDGLWFTSNDVVSAIAAYEYGESGQLSRHIRYAGAFDGELDGNDYVTDYYSHETSNAARIRERFVVNGYDIDSPTVYLDEYSYDLFDGESRKLAWGTFGSEGDDETWHTNDDVMKQRAGGVYRYEFDDNGIPEQHVIFLLNNGENKTRFDGDELVNFYYVHSYDETSQLTYWRYYRSVDGPAEITEDNFWLYFEKEYLDETIE